MGEGGPALVLAVPRSRVESAVAALRGRGADLRRFGRSSGPGLLVAALALAACTSSSAPPQPQTARVERTTVFSAVSSSGALAASSEQNLGFRTGGRLTAVNVQVGDRVTAGQVLATLDDGPTRRALEQQQAQLDAQRAVLDRLVGNPAVQNARNSVEQAQAILDATEDQVRATREADESALERAEKQLDFDEDVRDDAEDQRDDDEDACEGSTGVGNATTGTFTFPFSAASTPFTPSTTAPSPTDPATGDDPAAGEMPAEGTSSTTGATDDSAAAEDEGLAGIVHSRMRASAAGGGSTATGTTPGTGTGTTPGTGTGTEAATTPGAFSALTAPVDPLGSGACSRVASDESAVTQAERQVVASRTARDAARQRRDVDAAAGRVSIENARQGVVNAQNSLSSSAADRPSTIAQQQAVIAGLDAAVRQAQQDVDDTVLRAPVDGTVSALNGRVGEYVESGGATSALAPGSDAVIPGTGASAAAAASAVARPGGTQFLVLDGVDTFQVVVPFAEADAARIAPSQNVDVTFDAIPDLTRRGTVLGVAPAATASSGVISYYVTVLLTETDQRLRNGQTAQAAVHTDEMRDVLAVPNSAVRRESGRTTVTVVGPGGVSRSVPFEAGVVGDTLTQVVSGLTVGDQVVVGDRR